MAGHWVCMEEDALVVVDVLVILLLCDRIHGEIGL